MWRLRRSEWPWKAFWFKFIFSHLVFPVKLYTWNCYILQMLKIIKPKQCLSLYLQHLSPQIFSFKKCVVTSSHISPRGCSPPIMHLWDIITKFKFISDCLWGKVLRSISQTVTATVLIDLLCARTSSGRCGQWAREASVSAELTDAPRFGADAE